MRPALPEVARSTPGQLERIAASVERLSAAEARLEPGVDSVLRHLARNRLIDSLAGLEPAGDSSHQMAMAPRRRFLTAEQHERRRACRSALVHVDTRLAMIELGHFDQLVADETHMVLHAIIEASDPSETLSNAGLVRATDVGFRDVGVRFVPPPGDSCGELLRQLIAQINSGPRAGFEPLEVAAWATACTMLVHPFVDGNGRTARALFQLIHSAGLGSFDWVSLEEWALDRGAYVGALQEVSNPSAGGWYPERMDMTPFLDFVVDRFERGVARRVARLRLLTSIWTAPMLDGLDDDARTAAVVVGVDRNVGSVELEPLIDAPASEVADELVERSLAVRDSLGLQPHESLRTWIDSIAPPVRT
ncbi:MAG: Fic family protein [Actinomycetota bacterium]